MSDNKSGIGNKKAGIIVGAILIIISISIFYLTKNIDKKENLQGKTIKNETKIKDSNINDVKNKNNINKNKKSDENIMNNEDINQSLIQTSSIKEISNDILKYFNNPQTEIMIVSKKKLMLADLNKSEKDEKQILFVMELLNSYNEKISLYVNQNIYNTMEIGNKLNVTYNTYINTNGIKIPFICEVVKIEE
ncbi:hypothetical protein [Clostridioides difficile]|uniref:hypothetical protein n=1 Tax=Clostridioides difficile TaxID=1496 RepID=UPI001033842E|nr:hypothetical protein [Clostridioides difficile]MDM9944017.1 hypothetical protein [Clostridioides difficile]